MRRFEFVEGTSSKFWEAEVSGNTVCYGKIGTAGKAETKVFTSEVAAQAEADKLIREKTKKGYQEVAAAVAQAGAQDGKELEQAIWDSPDDDSVWQVYADWLQQQGNPLGEYISLSIARKSNFATVLPDLETLIVKGGSFELGPSWSRWKSGLAGNTMAATPKLMRSIPCFSARICRF
jgi:uncharacterized protein (TIGR02996 family)